jgi:hypothetical protein
MAPGSTNCGSIFELQPPTVPGGAWSATVLYSFARSSGDACDPSAPPIIGPDGALYGVTDVGGANDVGAVYEIQPPAAAGGGWTETVPYSFTALATAPFSVIIGPNRTLYVGTTGGGADGTGSLFGLDPPAAPGGSWSGTVLYSFPPGNEGGPTSLTLGRDGVFYGTIAIGGTAPLYGGAAFELAPPAAPGGTWTETVLHYFQSHRDGCTPNALTPGDDGILYGTTFGTILLDGYPGPHGLGTVFELIPPASPGAGWTKTVLRQFGKGDLHGPDSPLILRNGKLYGTSSTPKGGVVFEMQPPATPGGSWTRTILHAFVNGETPGGNLVMDKDGAIYGVTQVPNSLQGTVYRIAPE